MHCHRILITAPLIAAFVIGACGGGGASTCTLNADGRSGYRWGWTAGTIIKSESVNPDNVDLTDPLLAYRPGYTDGFISGVGLRHVGAANRSSSADYANSIGYQRGFRDGSEDGYADMLKGTTNPSGDFNNGYYAGFYDGLQGNDVLCDLQTPG